MTNRRIVGLTGGIATGKSTVSNYLKKRHKISVFDADVYARQAVEKGSEILKRIAERYGGEMLQEDGTLKRKKLGEIIFKNPEEKQWLEEQIHPYVRDRLEEDAHNTDDAIVVLDVPLLFEANMTDLATEIWVVYCTPQQQRSRLMQRDALSAEQAQARIHSQMSIETKRDRADVVLDNSATREQLIQQIDAAVTTFGDNKQM
ncbi:dephospho-CoA kinase [Phormidium sp. CCY1219]|uniref:dephospho-CoA kinase n=1 Tax=Phormidium sp. CCY1219 TaxID=2886104 RepID=UPI002D1E67D1|nr:dephospho-CoA kinase [Phormidium sp. CCY1219]MEB3830968.1 dephospho-CoA kinase [Phormidium sp. CCY1219]